MGKGTVILISIVLFFLLGVFSVFSNPEFLPEHGIAAIQVAGIKSDPGVGWLLDSWKSSERESYLRDFVKTIGFDTLGVSILPIEYKAGKQLVIVIDVDDRSIIDYKKLTRVLLETEETQILQRQFQSHTISYADNEVNDYNAFTVIDRTILIGTSPRAVEDAISMDSITGKSRYKDAMARLSNDKEVVLFADNRNLQFSQFLTPLQKKWKLTLLLSADTIEWIGFSFNVINADTLSGRMIFKGSDSSSIDDVVDDANFIGEAFRRKFMAENISYSSDVKVNGTYVTLSFDSKGLEPLWLRLFEKGVMSVIRPE